MIQQIVFNSSVRKTYAIVIDVAKIEKIHDIPKRKVLKVAQTPLSCAKNTRKSMLYNIFLANHLANKKKLTTFAFANKKHRGVEQLVARQAHNLEVTRSSRVSATQ